MSAGVVAGGNPLTVEAGLEAYRLGGNAVDAAVASVLMACVCEPLLIGLGGGGVALIRVDGELHVLDAFADVPGRGLKMAAPAPMNALDLDFGVDTQRFWFGAGSVAVPALAPALWALHDRFGAVSLPDLAAPAVKGAREGVPISGGLKLSIDLLWPILRTDPLLAAMFGHPDGRAKAEGEGVANPALAGTIARLAESGADFLMTGDGARAALACVEGSRLTAEDLAATRGVWRQPLTGRYRGSDLHVPGPPSQGGAQVLRLLKELEATGPLPTPLSGDHIVRIGQAMVAMERAKGGTFQTHLFEAGFAEGFAEGGSGHTTHVSTADAEGNAVAFTGSLGETAGLIVGETGIILNNFLGEADVNPPHAPRQPGQRLMTMMTPTLLDHEGAIHAMGSGGSSRIRSALLHGVLYKVDHRWPEARVVQAPRCHYEDDVLRVEGPGRPDGYRNAVEAAFDEVIFFDEPGLFFGGLHIAGWRDGHLFGAGDGRRSGTWGRWPA